MCREQADSVLERREGEERKRERERERASVFLELAGLQKTRGR